VWSLDWSHQHDSVVATGSRDGFVKIWKVVESQDSTTLELLHSFGPASKSGSTVEPVTAIAFCPKYCNDGADILAIGLHSGQIELWKVFDAPNRQCRLLTMLNPHDCHGYTVKKLAWKPSSNKGQILASCGLDHSVRLFEINL